MFRRNRPWAAAAFLYFCGVFGVFETSSSGTAWADEIRLKDGTELSASVLSRDGDNVVVQLPRSNIATINGRPLQAPVTTGAVAPEFQAVDLTGTPQTLASAGGQVTLLQFWATWCPHCRADVALMKDLFARYHNQGLRIMTVSVDQDLSQLRSFIQNQQLPYAVIPVYDHPASAREQSTLPELYEVRGIPAYYLIDSNGMIAQTYSGSVTEARKDLEGDLKRLLAASEAHE